MEKTMRLPDYVEKNTKERAVETFEASRWTAAYWNERRNASEPRFFCGWYWYTKQDTNIINGPFKTRSAAIRDAYVRIVLRSNQMIDGETLVGSPRKVQKMKAA
jgi:hypothetical protein